MAELLSGNILSDGVVYHASDINAAINAATLLAGAINDQPVVTASPTQKLLVLDHDTGESLATTDLRSVLTLTSQNIQTSGNLNVHEGVSFSGQITVNVIGTLNDWAPTNFVKSTIINTVGTATVTGMVAPPTIGTMKVVTPNSGTLTLKKEDPGSAAANRMFWGTATQLVLSGSETATFLYFNSRWVLIATTDGV